MADNVVINHFFGQGADPTAADQFDFSLKSRSSRLGEMSSILMKHRFLRGFSPKEFRDMLEELGPSFVKIGQTLSTRSEILPQAYCDELALLQTQVAPLPFDQVYRALEDIFGDRLASTFSEIDPSPLGSASLAQVHKAVLADGSVVAIKVQRPGVRETMAQDIDIMRQLARGVSHFAKEDLMLNAQEVVEEIWETFLEETDFDREAENLEIFRRLNAPVVFIDCPHVYRDLCSERCLVMEYVEGIPIYKHDDLVKAGYDLEEIGEKILDNYATQVLDHGFFHADPHPGNIIIREGKIVYIDLGLMGHLAPTERAGFNAIVTAVGMQNPVKLKDALLAFAVSKDEEKIDHSRMLADLDSLLASYGAADVADLDIGAMLSDVLALTRACKVTLPPSITNVSRGIVTIEGTVADFIPNDSIMGIINAHITRGSDPIERAKDYLEDAAIDAQRAGEGATSALANSGEALRMLTRGQLKMNMEVLGSEAPLSTVSKIVNRLTIGIIIAGLFIGSSMVTQMQGVPTVFGFPFISFFGFLGAFVLSVWVVLDIWRKG
ncbi:MAG: AarF/ABC1/UbiB kinase family protein [Eggerthellaceae bacterium]|nr:AarF/ABC1/UbiB kinase family protein [Eggerthellaceae bacterium]